MSIREKIESIINSDTTELKEAVAAAELALEKVYELTEKFGLPVEIRFVGGMVPDSILANNDDYGTGFSAERLMQELCDEEGVEYPDWGEEPTAEYKALDELMDKLVELVGTDYISGNNCWDTSRC